MSNAPRLVYRSVSSITPDQACAVRARAWAYVFECFNRCAEQEGSPTPATLGNDGKIKEASADDSIVRQ